MEYFYFFHFLREPNCCSLLTLDGKAVSKTSRKEFLFCFMHLVEKYFVLLLDRQKFDPKVPHQNIRHQII